MESAHCAHVVQELYGLNVVMMVEYFFVLLCKSLDFARHNVHFLAMVYVIQVCRQLSNCLQTCMTYTIAECTVNKLMMMDRRTVRYM